MCSSALSRAGTRLVKAFLCVLIGILIAGQAAAHGGGTLQLRGVAAGPYSLTIWTSPEPVRTGEIHVTVGVGGVEGTPILDADVEVEITALRDLGTSLSGAATREQSPNKFLYEADFELTETGLYLVIVTVNGVQGHGSAGFELKVQPIEAFDRLGLGLVAGCVAVLVAWVVFRRRANVSV